MLEVDQMVKVKVMERGWPIFCKVYDRSSPYYNIQWCNKMSGITCRNNVQENQYPYFPYNLEFIMFYPNQGLGDMKFGLTRGSI